jgi:FlaA1/EpsC-like NDP-sugar epimerase
MNKQTIELILGRAEAPLNNQPDFEKLTQSRVLITGGNGSLGKQVARIFSQNVIDFLSTDIEECDVTNLERVMAVFDDYKPTHVLHLAADKHAPQGELHPESTFKVNILGTTNVLSAARAFNSIVTLASTCKSCDPETVYGASKLVAERITLNDGGSVARFFNVVNTAGNVYEIWNELETSSNIQVAECYRYFISAEEATSLLIRTLALSDSNPGRYIFEPGISHFMPDIARRLYPSRKIVFVSARRGDRRTEPLKAESERMSSHGERLIKVMSPHDPN